MDGKIFMVDKAPDYCFNIAGNLFIYEDMTWQI
jgi:hypothetical protein